MTPTPLASWKLMFAPVAHAMLMDCYVKSSWHELNRDLQAWSKPTCPASAVIRKGSTSKEEMHAALELQLLEVLHILSCSQLNRQRLIALGCLPAMARIIKVSSNLSSISATSTAPFVASAN